MAAEDTIRTDLGGVPETLPDDPEQEALLADSVGLALLVVLDTLTPPERLAFVLHDMFGAVRADRRDRRGSQAASRQLASRARSRVRGAAPEPDADRAKLRGLAIHG